MTIFTPQDSALLLIDHQVGTMQLIKNIPHDVVKQNAIALAKTAKILGLPVVLTSSQETNIQGLLLSEFKEILPEAYSARVQRAGIVNAWNDPNFSAAVDATGKKNLIMAGVTTSVCLVYPVLSAIAAGYQVQAVMDASGSPSKLAEDVSWRRMENAGAILTATDSVIAELGQDWSTAAGSQLIQVLFQHVLPSISA
ncbi:isochorismatase family protein [Cronbergia sp. UHCC 0137]|uniref:isochorismatase family protein n=1 Tax=Cronbergia sp. UHCC 0137 TaxID=3110239 RepID=UPI002B22197D|nr:isochorismatase family protein [Cronbergia sp. UHCC 0137]MEA5619966.1 isochorismatase family protein [Cronbergia sp. UHCC 0137]